MDDMNALDKNYDIQEELSIFNDFLFGKVMQDRELCRELLQRILPELNIEHIKYPELQKGIKPDAYAKSVRVDVYVRDEKGTVYDIEMQVADTQELPKMKHIFILQNASILNYRTILYQRNPLTRKKQRL